MAEQQWEYTDIIVEKKGPIGYIIINRPEKRNSVSTHPGGTISQIDQAANDMRDDPEIRVFIVSGKGDCFCSGLYQTSEQNGMLRSAPPTEEMPEATKWFVPELGKEPWARYSAGDRRLPESAPLKSRTFFWESFWQNPTPSIAVVDSFCLGAGLWLINVCDVVYATPNAVFSYPPIRRGASVVLTILPPWLMGRRMSMWAALTGNAVTADEAYNCGLITKIFDEDKIYEEAEKLATSIARVPPATNMFSKRAINNYYEGLGLEQAKNYGSALVLMTENSAAPGHYFDYYDNIGKYGFKEANRMQIEKHSFADEAIDKEKARLKAKKAK